MLINTRAFGSLDVEQEHIFHLPDGLYGFEQVGDFALISQQEDDITLTWLQAVDSLVPCFAVFNPFEIVDGYEPVVENADLKFLGCQSADDLLFLVIAVVPDDLQQITVNLKSPIVVNKQNRRARQVILANREYPIKFPLFSQQDATTKTE